MAKSTRPAKLKAMSSEREAIGRFRAQGYDHDFFLTEEGVRCQACRDEVLAPEDVQVDAYERTEGDSNPDEEALVLAVSDGPCGHKGILVTGYGPEIGGPIADVIRSLGG